MNLAVWVPAVMQKEKTTAKEGNKAEKVSCLASQANRRSKL